MSNSTRSSGMRIGLELLRSAVGDKDSYTLPDHEAAGLPVILACNGCWMSMAGASALIDADGYCWCADCVETRRSS